LLQVVRDWIRAEDSRTFWTRAGAADKHAMIEITTRSSISVNAARFNSSRRFGMGTPGREEKIQKVGTRRSHWPVRRSLELLGGPWGSRTTNVTPDPAVTRLGRAWPGRRTRSSASRRRARTRRAGPRPGPGPARSSGRAPRGLVAVVTTCRGSRGCSLSLWDPGPLPSGERAAGKDHLEGLGPQVDRPSDATNSVAFSHPRACP